MQKALSFDDEGGEGDRYYHLLCIILLYTCIESSILLFLKIYIGLGLGVETGRAYFSKPVQQKCYCSSLINI